MSKLTLPMPLTRLRASALAAALALLPLAAEAAGLGKLTVLSVLGQPLRAELDISASREELSSLSARMAQPEAFKQAGIEYLPALSGISFKVAQRQDGQPFLRLSSERSVNEPFVDMLVEISWASGRLVREYTFLLDPPEFLQKPLAAPAALPEAKREMPRPEVAAPVAPPAPAPAPAPAIAPAVAPAPMSAPPQPTKPRVAEAKPKPQPQPQPQEKVAAPTRVVKQGDTLSKIAGETKAEGVSLDQMLVALFSSNRDAFEGNNMNRLKAGRILSIPDHDAAAAVSQSEAKKTVVVQSADFDAYRKRLAAAAATAVPKETPATQSVSGKIVPKVEDKAPARVAGKDKLEVSTSESSKDAKAAAKTGAGRMTAIEEDLVARDKALKEANSRIAELEKNLADLRKLVELKSQGMAELQKQAEAQKSAAPTPPAAPEVSKSPPVAATPAVPAKAETPKAEPVVQQPAAPPPLPAPPPKPAAPVKPAALPEPSFVDDNPGLVYGGGGIIALLAGYLGYSSWRRKRLAAGLGPISRVSEGNIPASSVFGAGGQSVDTSQSSLNTDFSQSGMAAIDADEGVDPVAEADVYMAYGRDTQAEEILLDALKADPTRPAIQLKLLEIYAARKSLKQFETVASEFYRQTGGVGPDWEKAAIFVEKVDPEHPLYGRKPAAAEPEPPALILPEAEGEDQALPEEPAQIEEPTETEPPETPVDEELPASLDFDFDLGIPEPSAAPSAPPDQPAEAVEEEDKGFEFELAPVAGESPGEYSGAQTLVIPGRETTPEAEPPADMDLDLSAPEDGPAAAEDLMMLELERTNVKAARPLDVDFGEDRTAAAVEPAVSPTPPSLDLSKISLDLEPPPVVASVESVVTSPVVPPAASFEEVATKLELAHAYEEMGDKEGARELLQEVANEGNADQQAAARAKLAQLA